MKPTNSADASFFAYVEIFDGAPARQTLAQALHIDPASVHGPSRLLLRQSEEKSALADQADDLATSYRAYLCFQDLLELIISDSPFYHRHYFYFESLSYLREGMRCLLSNNFLAALTLQRPFLELAVFHIYWRSRDDDYTQFYRWIQTGSGKPPFKNAVEESFRNLDVADSIGPDAAARLRERIVDLYSDLCSYNHIAHIQDSFVAINSGNSPASNRAAAVAVAQFTVVLRQVMLLFGVAYPMVHFPRRLEMKFGIGGPVGLVASPETAALYRAAVGDSNSQLLSESFKSHPVVVSKLEWFDSHEDASAEELETSWQDHLRYAPMEHPPTDLRTRMAAARASFRATAWMLNYANLPDPLSDELAEDTDSPQNPMAL